MVGYADGFQTLNNYTANSDSAGIYIYDSHNIIQGYSGVSMTGIDMTGIGLYLGLWNTAGSNGIVADTGNINLQAINNTTSFYSIYSRIPLTASSGSITLSGAGYYGITMDNTYASSAITASGNINIIAYATGGYGLSIATGYANEINSTAGSIIFSAYTGGAGANYAISEGSTTSISAANSIIFQKILKVFQKIQLQK